MRTLSALRRSTLTPRTSNSRGASQEADDTEDAGGHDRRASSGGAPGDAYSRPDDPYRILGLEPGASPAEIRSAYRRLAARYHPDKVAHLGEEFQRLAEQKFKEAKIVGSARVAASSEDGRYVQVGSIREMEGLHPIRDVLAAGVTAVKTLDGDSVTDGMVLTDKMRPARRDSQPILFVEKQEEYWLPLKLD